MLINTVKIALQSAIKEIFNEKIEKIDLGIPPNVELGDFAFECFQLTKQLHQDPQKIAKKLAKEIKTNKVIQAVAAVGPYVNFKISRQALFGNIYSQIVLKNIAFNAPEKPQKTMVEYLSPNTNKPLHLGHLRNGSIGMAIANILESTGNTVIKANLTNDRGVHICKSMLAWKKWGQKATPESTGKKGDHFVGDWYVRFSKEAEKNAELKAEAQEMLKKWEKGDKDTLDLWKTMNNWVYDGFNKTYQKLGFKFDVFYYESDTYKLGKDIISRGFKEGVFYQDDNKALAFNLPESFGLNKDGSCKKVTVLRSDGTSVYITQDLGTAALKVLEHKLRRSIYVVGSEQNYHFKCLFEILSALGYPWAKRCQHLSYGMVYLPDGKMKSREGKVVDADSLVAEVEELALKEIRKRYSEKELSDDDAKIRAEKIGTGAIKFYLLRVHPSQVIRFNPQESISFDGFTGPYCQYAYARAAKILRDADIQTDKELKNINFSFLESSEELLLAQKIMQFSEKVAMSAKGLNPSLATIQIFEIAKAFNQFYQKNPILKADNLKLKKARIALTQMSAETIKKGLNLLGIETIEEM
ncbi:MAG: arginine--tRNA ligase [Patescibacteria group bacterium]|nr:arginine--tRNA ligase [Patescibacteria group bacterium]